MSDKFKPDFEWDLSKENIKPLTGGRSVDQLQIVLQSRNNPSFIRWCSNIRRRFEHALSICPTSRKLALYDRYIQWVEETFPALGATSNLKDILYRCVRDTSPIDGIHNQQVYVSAWLKLIEYCDTPTELFNLLFHNGVGTLTAVFYIAWCEHIRQFTTSTNLEASTRKIASILAHGLQANAQPFSMLEANAESFIQSKMQADLLKLESDEFLRRTPASSVSGTTAEVSRQTLSSLKSISAIGDASTAIIPSDRTGKSLSANQLGLHSLQNKPSIHSVTASNSASHTRKQNSGGGLTIFRDTSSATPRLAYPSSSSALSSAAICRLTNNVPQWNCENVKKSEVKLDRHAVTTQGSPPSIGTLRRTIGSRETLVIHRDYPKLPLQSSSETAGSSAVLRGRGLQLTEPVPGGMSAGAHNTLQVPALFSLDSLKSALLCKMEKQAQAISPIEVEFYCDLEALYVDEEERCFEMNEAMRRKLLPKESWQTKKGGKAKVNERFPASLEDERSQRLLKEIAGIIEGEGEEVPNEQKEASVGLSMNCNKVRTQLIEKLKAIAETTL